MSLNGNNIGDEGARYIADALKVNSSLHDIDLKHNNIGDEGAQAIAEALKVNGFEPVVYYSLENSIMQIDLGFNIISNLGASAFADLFFKFNSSVKSINLTENNTCKCPAIPEDVLCKERVIAFVFVFFKKCMKHWEWNA
jgi:Ran GTPase-activating protein (RanGAP) involved in mRNA processing and transport